MARSWPTSSISWSVNTMARSRLSTALGATSRLMSSGNGERNLPR